MDTCNYCHEEQPMASRHMPNCPLNPYFQNRYYQLPREIILKTTKSWDCGKCVEHCRCDRDMDT